MESKSTEYNPYETLGIDPDASLRDIKAAYRRIALETHPDRRPDDPAAAERFRLASRAYELLRDPERRRLYDRFGSLNGGSGPGFDVQLSEALSIFANAFAPDRAAPGSDVSAGRTARAAVPVEVRYEEIERGSERRIPVPCRRCGGSGGREGSIQVRCTACGGTGQHARVEEGFLGPKVRNEPCATCRGSGRRPLLACPACEGSGAEPGGGEVAVRIPRGVQDGDPLQAPGAPELALVARVVDDPRWARDGADLYVHAEVPYALAVLGGELRVELPGRIHRMTIPAGTRSGRRIRVPEQGLPRPGGDGRGDLVLTFQIAVPSDPGPIERWLLERRVARGPGDATGRRSRPTELAAAAWDRARREWRRWKQRCRESAIEEIEATAESLRSAASVIADFEAGMGPLLDDAYKTLAPQAGKARRRIESLQARERNQALGTAVLDLFVSVIMAVVLWWALQAATPATAVPDFLAGPWIAVLSFPPWLIALVPLLAGVAVGGLELTPLGKIGHTLLSVPPVGLSVAAGIAPGLAGYILILEALPPEARAPAGAPAALAAAVGVVLALSIVVVGAAMVHNLRNGVAHELEQNDRGLLKRMDETSARVGAQLERVTEAFQQLLVRAEDPRRPLASLLARAADALTEDRRPTGLASNATALLLRGVVVLAAWTSATAAALWLTLDALAGPTSLRIAAAVVIVAVCGLGAAVPFPPRAAERGTDALEIVAVLAAILALAGLALGAGSAAEPAWLAAVAAVAAVALSFRLPRGVAAAGTAVVLAVTGATAIVLSAVGALLDSAARLRGRTAPGG